MLFTGLITFAMLTLSPTRAHAQMQKYPRVAAAARHDRILIVAPHIDDEVIAAGGYAADAIAGGAEVFVVFLTAGDCNRFSARLMHKTFEPTPSNYLDVGRARIVEARAAMKILGVAEDHFFVLGYPDRGLRSMLDNRSTVVRSRGTAQRSVPYDDAMTPGATYTYESLMRDMANVVALTNPTTVIAPVPFDMHPDHSAAAAITDLALSRANISPARLGYLIHMGRIPTAWVNKPGGALLPPSRMKSYSWATYTLSDRVVAVKREVLMTYKSQRPYVFLLRNKFVRRNELFFVYPPAAVPLPIPVAAAPARLSIAR
jgi:LmbE family N-acetylglucosaminyl deacetylase